METNKRNQRSYSGEHENWDQEKGRQNDYNQSRNIRSNYGNTWDNDNNWRGNQYNQDRASTNRNNDNDNGWNNSYGYSDQRSQQGGRYDTGDYIRNRQQEGYRHQDTDRNYDFNNNYQNRSFGGRDFNIGRNYQDVNRGDDRFSKDNYDSQERNWLDRTRDEVSSWFGDDDAERRRREDKQREGQHRGKGPKDYLRSSDRIREDISDRLSDDSYIDASDIDVKVSGNEVTLTGTVDSKEAKRRAEDIADSVSGVSNVQNQLRVGQSVQTASTPYQTKSQTTAAQQKNEKERQN